ncbi:DUF6470 family protein [Sporosarcina trichiuri]|uniref:DUF6470 family protein n=1 Tax=Sporosarcina trichiuri TaxID=3056445 RepID=UPI0025B496B2|nr:DUF6470 family protein [Sporosarcina sp. 0.2-SM1T-5]WJY26128.1 DUF6470 family protein [Sporosarcina sp. 0.2-SM1T-5]
MDIPKLQIQTTPGRLGLQIDKPVQQIEQPRAILDIQQPAAILEISTTRSRLSIDTTEVRADIDMKSVFRRTQEWAQQGRQGGLDGTGRRAEEGRQMMEIENGGGAIPAIAKQNGSPPTAPLGIRFVGDRSKIQLSITPGTTTINATPQKPIINAQVNKPIHTYTPGKVTGTMEQYPSIQIDWKG